MTAAIVPIIESYVLQVNALMKEELFKSFDEIRKDGKFFIIIENTLSNIFDFNISKSISLENKFWTEFNNHVYQKKGKVIRKIAFDKVSFHEYQPYTREEKIQIFQKVLNLFYFSVQPSNIQKYTEIKDCFNAFITTANNYLQEDVFGLEEQQTLQFVFHQVKKRKNVGSTYTPSIEEILSDAKISMLQIVKPIVGLRRDTHTSEKSSTFQSNLVLGTKIASVILLITLLIIIGYNQIAKKIFEKNESYIYAQLEYVPIVKPLVNVTAGLCNRINPEKNIEVCKKYCVTVREYLCKDQNVLICMCE